MANIIPQDPSTILYDVLIVGAGPAGLFAAAGTHGKIKGLVLFNTKTPGLKLLMSGSGQCNLTQDGDIRNFIPRYGPHGKSIRKVLYSYNNHQLRDFMSSLGVYTQVREDGKVFPLSMNSKEVLDALVQKAEKNGFQFLGDQVVTSIAPWENGFILHTNQATFHSRKIVLATGGLSYPTSGSDGSILPVLKELGIEVTESRPSLAPIFIEGYPFSNLSGLSFPHASVEINKHQQKGGLLLTHQGFSGPVILNLSRYATSGGKLVIDWIPSFTQDYLLQEFMARALKGGKEILTTASEALQLTEDPIPRRFLQSVLHRCGIDPSMKAAQFSKKQAISLVHHLKKDTYTISHVGDYKVAMATSGGVALEEVGFPEMESKKYPGLYIIGEALDVDGDTGGYNIQFAFSSGFSCIHHIKKSLNSF